MPKANPYREALMCYRLKGLSYLETSKIVGIPKSTARKWYEEWKDLFILPLEEIKEIQSNDASIEHKDIDHLIKDRKKASKKVKNLIIMLTLFFGAVFFESQHIPEIFL